MRHNQCSVESHGDHTIVCLGKCDIKCIISPECTDNIKFLIVKSSPLMENKNIIPILVLESYEKYDLIKKNDMITYNKEIFIKNNINVFIGLGKFHETHKIQFKSDAQPKPALYRRVPQIVRERFIVKLKEFMEKGIVTNFDEPTDWLNNIVIIEKPNKSLRICLDPQQFNKNIVEKNFLIPTFDEITPKLLNKSVYTVLDLKDRFWQVELIESCNNLCSFPSPIGKLKFNKLPIGIKTDPMVFQKYNIKYFGNIQGLKIYLL